jgi:hypothetical protein
MANHSLRLERVERALMPDRNGDHVTELIAQRVRELLGDVAPGPDAGRFARECLAAIRGQPCATQ